MKKIFLAIGLSGCIISTAQECKNCDKPSKILMIDIQGISIGVPKAEDTLLLKQWNKLKELSWAVYAKMYDLRESFRECSFITHYEEKYRQQLSPEYLIYGIINQFSSAYVLKLWLQPACSNKIMAETEVRFQLYPELDVDLVATKAASQFAPLIKIPEFELQERTATKLPIANKGDISLFFYNRALKPGTESEVQVTVRDCDGKPLVNKEVTLEGIGGTVTPAKVITDKIGSAIIKFKYTSSKGAYLKAKLVTNNVKGCLAVFTGSEAIVPGLVLVRVEFKEFEEKIVDPNIGQPLPGFVIEGGKGTEVISTWHFAEFYHMPSPEALKKGFLVYQEKTGLEGYGSTSPQFIQEGGMATYSLNSPEGELALKTGDEKLTVGKQESNNVSYSGAAPDQSAEIIFNTGDGRTPPYFYMMLSYPLTNENSSDEYSFMRGVNVVKGKNPSDYFKSRKITDPKSPFKTEYKIKSFVDMGIDWMQAQKKVGKFKGLIQIDSEGLSIKGYRYIDVTILSPY